MIPMKYTPTQDYSFLLDENHYVYDHVENEDSLHIYIKSKEHGCKCPICGKMSTKLHATYRRKFQDTPIRCKQTFLHANVYKYDCENPDCECKVFMEDLPFAKASQVRTDALNTLILAVSMYLSNEGASKVLALLGVQVSNDTIQRLYDRIEFIDNPDVEAIGVDDVAIRKGQTYATAIYDLKDHHLIALLDGRDGVPLKEWLTVISRADLLKYILTCNPKTKRDSVIEKYIGQIKSSYPVVTKVEKMFKEFHSLLMGKDEEKLDEYLRKYSESEIQSFCNGIKKDILPVKNAISFSISSGFVEGNNNKFKVLKRIVYGRSGLVNLEKKCKLAFIHKSKDFSLSALL